MSEPKKEIIPELEISLIEKVNLFNKLKSQYEYNGKPEKLARKKAFDLMFR